MSVRPFISICTPYTLFTNSSTILDLYCPWYYPYPTFMLHKPQWSLKACFLELRKARLEAINIPGLHVIWLTETHDISLQPDHMPLKQAVGATPKVMTSLSIMCWAQCQEPAGHGVRLGWSKRSHNNVLIVHSILLFKNKSSSMLLKGAGQMSSCLKSIKSKINTHSKDGNLQIRH